MNRQRRCAGSTVLPGLGFFGVSVIWALYSAGAPGSAGAGCTVLCRSFSQAAHIFALPAAGALIDSLGYASPMVSAAIPFVAAFLVMSLVKRGETTDGRAA